MSALVGVIVSVSCIEKKKKRNEQTSVLRKHSAPGYNRQSESDSLIHAAFWGQGSVQKSFAPTQELGRNAQVFFCWPPSQGLLCGVLVRSTVTPLLRVPTDRGSRDSRRYSQDRAEQLAVVARVARRVGDLWQRWLDERATAQYAFKNFYSRQSRLSETRRLQEEGRHCLRGHGGPRRVSVVCGHRLVTRWCPSWRTSRGGNCSTDDMGGAFCKPCGRADSRGGRGVAGKRLL